MSATVVPTRATAALAAAMITTARREGSGAEAVILHLDHCHPEQVAALMALVLDAALGRRGNGGRSRKELIFTDAGRRAAHVAYTHGDRGDWATVGHREYKRVAARKTRDKARAEQDGGQAA